MDFFRDPFWGFGQFLLAAIDFVRSLRRSSSPEAKDQQKPSKEHITEITTDGRFCVLLMISTFASSDFYVFLPQVFAAGVPFDKDVLSYVSIMCFLFLAMVILFYQKVLFGIFIFFHFCIACTFTALIAWTIEVGVPSYQLLLLLHDLQVKNVTSIRIIFLITYLITFVLIFPAYLIYRKANGTPKQNEKKNKPPLQQY